MEDPDIFGDISRMHQKQITVHAGDEGLAETGRTLYVEPDWTTDDLLQAAGRRLELASTPKRMFSSNGGFPSRIGFQTSLGDVLLSTWCGGRGRFLLPKPSFVTASFCI